MKKVLKKLKLTWYFYRNFCLISLLISIVLAYALWHIGMGGHLFFYIFWFKVLTLGLIYYFITLNKKNEFYYYQNLGLSMRRLWMVTLSFDFILFIFLLILVLSL